jgi:hypothetical protein
MTQDEILRMAREAGADDLCIRYSNVFLTTFAALVAEATKAQPQDHSEQHLNMVQGEPVYAFRRKGLDDFCTCDKRRYLELSDKPNLFETTIFYTTPPSVEAAIEATKEKAAKVCEVIAGQNPDTALTCAAAIRSMK